jgi:hypothetical protein
MRARWVRLTLTILISMMSIAFFGFANIIGSFNINNLLYQDNQNSPFPYMTVGLSHDSDTSFRSVQSWMMNDWTIDEFKKLEIDFVNKYLFHNWPFVEGWVGDGYIEYFPRAEEALVPMNEGVIETNDISKLGLNVIGREAQNFHEIVITNYQLEVFKRFGFKDHNDVTHTINSFADMEGKILRSHKPYQFAHNEDDRYYDLLVVGMVEFDLSPWQNLIDINTIQTNISREQRHQLYRLRFARHNGLNMWLVREGFYQQYFPASVYPHEIRIRSEWHGDSVTAIEALPMQMSDELFSFAGIMLRDGISSINDISGNQIILHTGVLEQILDIEIDAISDIPLGVLGETFTMSAVGVAPFFVRNHVRDIEVEIVGIIFHDWKACYFSPDLIGEFYFERTNSIIVPALTSTQQRDLINKINSHNGFTHMERDYFFYVLTTNSHEIYNLDAMFSLFSTIFVALAIIFCGFAIMLAYNFISTSVRERRRDIGIMRSLGINRATVANVFIFESIFIAICQIALGITACFVGFHFASNLFASMGLDPSVNLISFTASTPLLMIALSIGSLALATFLPILRITRKQPAETIRN